VAPIFGISFLVGGFLSFRFRFLVLMPVFFVAAVVIVISGVAWSAVPSTIGLAIVMLVLGLQSGYAAGIVLRVLEGLNRRSEQRARTQRASPRSMSSQQLPGSNVAFVHFPERQEHDYTASAPGALRAD